MALTFRPDLKGYINYFPLKQWKKLDPEAKSHYEIVEICWYRNYFWCLDSWQNVLSCLPHRIVIARYLE